MKWRGITARVSGILCISGTCAIFAAARVTAVGRTLDYACKVSCVMMMGKVKLRTSLAYTVREICGEGE